MCNKILCQEENITRFSRLLMLMVDVVKEGRNNDEVDERVLCSLELACTW